MNRPYDAYPLTLGEPFLHTEGDALARLRVRWDEVASAFTLVRHAAAELSEIRGSSSGSAGPHFSERSVVTPLDPPDGRAIGWAEAPRGEVLYDVTIAHGRIAWCQPRSPSFHNLVLMHEVFKGDILTDFPFIEASFGLSAAGAAL